MAKGTTPERFSIYGESNGGEGRKKLVGKSGGTPYREGKPKNSRGKGVLEWRLPKRVAYREPLVGCGTKRQGGGKGGSKGSNQPGRFDKGNHRTAISSATKCAEREGGGDN